MRRVPTIVLSIFALAIGVTGTVQAQDEPIITGHRGETAQELRVREAAAYAYELPRGAPEADYALVAWCEALVSGHVALGESLQTSDSLDLDIIRLGRLERTDFRSALAVAQVRQSPAILAQAEQAVTRVNAQWAELLSVTDIKARSEAFGLFYGIPGRCEHAARRIRDNITTPPAKLSEVAR